MKVGDIINRKDMPELKFRIRAESDERGGVWFVEPASVMASMVKPAGRGKRGYKWDENRAMVFKDDDRWELSK